MELTVIISPFVALISAVILWFLNERSKRRNAIYLEKLKLYEGLMKSVHSFYDRDGDKEKDTVKEIRQTFNNNICVAWIYASKEVIEKADAFLETTRTGNSFSSDDRSDALDLLVKAIRNDMKLSQPEVKFKTWISE